jgi:hypothetical protein
MGNVDDDIRQERAEEGLGGEGTRDERVDEEGSWAKEEEEECPF